MPAIGLQKLRPEDFREPSSATAAQQVHLEKSIPSRHKTKCSKGIGACTCLDARDPVPVELNLNGRAETFQRDYAIQHRQRCV